MPGSSSSPPAAAVICEAIRKRCRLEFEYRGLPRVVEPYCHGVSTRGAESLRAVQVGGESSSGGYGFGKLWTVAEMRAPRLSAVSFVPNDPNYNPDDNGMKTIHCRI
jgi:hypothetical protein